MTMGTEIPKLCATDMVDAFGSCRICLVEIEGRAGTPASCTTPVASGMVVRTQTPRLQQPRRGVMELYVSDHPNDGFTNPANALSELPRMAAPEIAEFEAVLDQENPDMFKWLTGQVRGRRSVREEEYSSLWV